ncbi:hypothetical protein PG985_003752 [Apiospora marii]|uniref:uncharacterized protein n=1 Tax=Apiospora marii TaxID=335849 RepID=UPI00312FFBD7
MPDNKFIQCTGEPERLHSARIPRALWEEKRSQIISLFKDLTLNEVIEKMKQDGFTANRRQYVYQLEQWGSKKYKAQSNKSPDADDALGSKRKPYHQDASASSSSHVVPSSKRPKVSVEWEIGPEEDMLQTSADDNIERPTHTTGAGLATRVGNSSRPSAKHLPLILTHYFYQSPAHQLAKLLHASKTHWFWQVINTLGNLEISKDHHHRSYLQDIGDYLCGIKEWDEALEIYELALDHSGLSHNMNVDRMIVSYVRCADAPEACQLAASFLRDYHIRRGVDPGSLMMAHLVLASNFARHGRCADAEEQVQEAQRLDKQAYGNMKGRSAKGWSILTSIIDWYWFKIQRDCGLFGEDLWITRESVWGNSIWPLQCSPPDLSLLRSALLDFFKIIKEKWLDNGIEALGGEAHENDMFSLSVIFFRIIWHAQFEKSQVRGVTMGKSSAIDGQWWRDLPLPDFVGPCCDILAGKAMGRRLSETPRTPKAWRDCLRKRDLGSIVSRMDARDLHLAFLGFYCNRDGMIRSTQRGDIEDDYDYRPPVETITYWEEEASAESTEIGGSDSPKQDPETFSTSPTTTPRLTKLPALLEDLAGNDAMDDSQLSSDTDMSTSFQPRLAPHGNGSVDNYYLDPTWGSPCRSSLASYGHMIEARAAMARGRKQAEDDKPAKGAGGSLPSAMIRMEELSVSMGSVSLQDM